MILVLGFFVVLPIVIAQTNEVIGGSTVSDESRRIFEEFDVDNDNICDKPRSEYANRNVKVQGCVTTSLGDVCPDTSRAERAYTSGDRSGCGESQLLGFTNYWIIGPDRDDLGISKMRPPYVKPNWLTDQRQGLRVYQPLKLEKNPSLSESEIIDFRRLSVRCDRGRGVVKTKDIETSDVDIEFERRQGGGIIDTSTERNGVAYVDGNYGNVQVIPYDQDDWFEGKNPELVIKLNHQTEDLIRPKDIKNYKNEFGIDEIEFQCIATISQCKRVIKDGKISNTCSPIYPPETDDLRIVVPIDSRAFKAPDELLEAGIATAGAIITLTEKLEPKLERLYSYLRTGCIGAIGSVFLGKLIGGVVPKADEFANFIWYGPKRLEGYGLHMSRESGTQVNNFILSGRSMCAAIACPRDWCRALNWKPQGPESKSLADLTDGAPIQNSLVLSASCGCVSGMLNKLYHIQAIAKAWRTCTVKAQQGKQFVGECERLLEHGMCEFVIDEVATFDGFNFGFLDKIRGTSTDVERTDAAVEAVEAQGLLGGVNEGYKSAKGFTEEEVVALGDAAVKGNFGYSDHELARTFCSYALYKELPDLGTGNSYDLDKIGLITTTSSNFDSEIAYFDQNGNAVYSYEVSWMIVSGKDNLRYEIYLQTDSGSRRPLHNSLLRKLGDFEQDYMEITDDVVYTNICFDIPAEVARIRCAPIGTSSSGGILGDLNSLFGKGIEDTDNDRLPDDWEKRFSCFEGRDTFESTEDREACENLIGQGKNNLLDFTKENSDGKGVNDGSEDPDNDGVNNYQEYRTDGHPNVASRGLDGTVARSDCIASFDDFEIEGGESFDKAGISEKFVPGEKLKVKINNAQILNDLEENKLNKVVARVEITGPRLFSANTINIPFSQLNTGSFDIWTIQTGNNAPRTGIYEVTVTIMIPGGFLGGEICRSDAGTLVKKTKRILVYDQNRVGCEDSDFGINYNLGAFCADTNAVYVDNCNVNEVSDYYCNGGKCEKRTSQCANECREGGCNEPVSTPVSEPTQSLTADFSSLPSERSLSDNPDLIPTDFSSIPFTEEELRRFQATKTRILANNNEILNEVITSANIANVIPASLLGIITQESRGIKDAHNDGSGAHGLVQILPSTVSYVNTNGGYSLNYNNWKENILLGGLYLKEQLEIFNDDEELALGAYHSGPGNVQNWCEDGNNRYVSFSECKSSFGPVGRDYVPSVRKYKLAWAIVITDLENSGAIA